jgi:uncharacterized protein (DUF58 family)
MRETYVKVFTEEREMTVMLLVDLSASGLFGSVSQPKQETAAEVAALLAFSAIKNNDRVGLIMFTDQVERFVPPKKGKGHVMRVVTEILSAKPARRGTDVRCALELLGHVQKRKCVAFLISDFIASGYERALRITSARHDLIPLQILDPREEQLPDVGVIAAEDLETGELYDIDTSSRTVREAYATRVARLRSEREQLFRRLDLDHLTIQTDRPYVRPIAELFRRRQRRERHG